jgi:hypothetical protein
LQLDINNLNVTVGTKHAQSNIPSPKLQNKKTHNTDNTNNILDSDTDNTINTSVTFGITLATHITDDMGETCESYKVQFLQQYLNIIDMLHKSQWGVHFSIITETPYPTTEQKDEIVNSTYTTVRELAH